MTLEEEKEKSLYDHKLELVRTVVDKICLGGLIALCAFVANFIIEDFKDDLTKRRFLLESRLQGLQALRKAYDKLSQSFYIHAHTSGEIGDDIRGSYQASINEFIGTSNQWSVVFSNEFHDGVNRHVWIHDGVASGEVQVTTAHWAFAIDIFYDFDALTRRALWEETLGVSGQAGSTEFSLVEWDSAKAARHTGSEYFQENFQRWEQQRSSRP